MKTTYTIMNTLFQKSPLCLATVLLGCSVQALAAPDAGGLLREEIRREEASSLKPKSVAPVQAADAPKPLKTTGPKVNVTGYRIVGLSDVSENDAQEFLQDYNNQTISLDGLHDVAERFEVWLRTKGLFTARAYIPPQDIRGGEVEMRVLVGKIEGVDVKLTAGSRVSEATISNLMSTALPSGSAMVQAQLERGILLANDLPATSARVVLVPGNELGGSRVLVEAAQGALVSGNVDLDNTGSRYTGEWRLGTSVAINDPMGRGDQFTARLAASEGSVLARVGYLVPIGADGWKVGANYIDSRYKLCCAEEVAVLQSEGGATAASGFVTYPVIRSRLNNLSVTGSISQRKLTNRAAGTVTSDKKSQGITLGLSGDRSNMLGWSGLGGFTIYGVQLTAGNINLDAVANEQTQDEAGAQTQGNFAKVYFQASHLMRLTKQSALYAATSAQYAGKNLDSSEKFVLGGAQGVRAYPSGEGAGDSGWMLNLEYRYEINNKWSALGFMDYGSVQQRKKLYDNWNSSNPNVPNNYDLSGVGGSLAWTPAPGRQVMLTLATRTGDNPARDANGNNSDGRSGATRLWLQSTFAF